MQTEIGNRLGVAAKSPTSNHLATVAANLGTNQLSLVSDGGFRRLEFTQLVDCYSPAGVARFTGRQVNVVLADYMSYTGADEASVVANDLIFIAGTRGNAGPSNLNGGVSSQRGLSVPWSGSLDEMRKRLNEINPTYYTEAAMDKLSYNDLVYALRLTDAPGSI